jgi:hypothetical protein
MRVFVLALAASMLTACASSSESNYSYRPPEGYVPNAKTAIRIAEAVWLPIYGKKVLDDEKPFLARLSSDQKYWIVEGNTISWAPGDVGGVALIYISKEDGTILRVSHGQ